MSILITVTYIPSAFSAINCTVTDADNMYHGVDSDLYAVVNPPNSVYLTTIFLTNFITDLNVPNSAKIISGRFRLKMRSSNSANYICQAARDTSYNSSGYAWKNFGQSNSVQTNEATTGYLIGELNSAAINALKTTNIASNFVLHLKPADSGSSASGNGSVLYVYGADLQIDYSIPCNKVTVNKNGTPETLIDLTADTVTPETLLSGYTAHDKSGSIITGTYEASIPSNYGLITWDGSVLTVS